MESIPGLLKSLKIPSLTGFIGLTRNPHSKLKALPTLGQNLSSSHGIKQVSTLSPNYHILVPVPATVVEYSSSVLIVLNALDGKSEGYLIFGKLVSFRSLLHKNQ